MFSPKFDRRRFAQHLSHSILAGALSRIFNASHAFGAPGMRKLMVLTTPNGQATEAMTHSVFKKAVGGGIANDQAVFISGVKSVFDGNWHGSEKVFFSYSGNKSDTPPFFAGFKQKKKALLSVSGDQYIRDSKGGAIRTIGTPELAMRTFFSGNRRASASDFNLIEQGRLNLLDPALEDMKAIKRLLGNQEAVIFDDYVFALQELYNREVEAGKISQEQMIEVFKDMMVEPEESDMADHKLPKPEKKIVVAPPLPPEKPLQSKVCTSKIPAGNFPDIGDLHAAMLDVAFQLMACDKAEIVTLPFLDSKVDIVHKTIHSDGNRDNGKKFTEITAKMQTRIGKFISKFSEDPEILNQSAIVYSSEGGDHIKNKKFNPDHPKGSIPMVIFGRLGGAIKAKGNLNGKGHDQRSVWRSLSDGMNMTAEELKAVDGSSIKPLAGL